MAKYNSLSALFTAIADAIRSKTGGTDTIVADDFPTAIEGISAGGGDSDRTYFTYTWRGTGYKFFFLPGQTWAEWLNDTKYANVGCELNYFYGELGIVASFDWVQVSEDYGYDVADFLSYPDTGNKVNPGDVIQPIEYSVIYWND